jgi:pimeloyl-ACP methyl ester carboxylesterase
MSEGVYNEIQVNGHDWQYLKMGGGSKWLIAFHGYGEDATQFSLLVPYIQGDYTILSICLPYHGEGTWAEDTAIMKAELVMLTEALCKRYDFVQYGLLGYSIGGRVCLCLLEQVPEQVTQVVLIASDGLITHPYYYFLTQNILGQNMFKSFVERPDGCQTVLQWLRKKNMLDAARYKFISYYTHSDHSRQQLYKVWMSLRYLLPVYSKLCNILRNREIPMHLFMGAYDRIIPIAQAHTFCKAMQNAVQLHILEKGHDLLDPETLPMVADSLLA